MSILYYCNNMAILIILTYVAMHRQRNQFKTGGLLEIVAKDFLYA